MKIIFFYLDAFSQIGGIEKFNKALMKALSDIAGEGDIKFEAVSVYDSEPDERYIKNPNYKGFNGGRIRSSLYAIKTGLKSDLIIFGHINLSLIGIILKILKPSTKIILIAHGVEVWRKLSFVKGTFLKQAYKIFAVSSFTKEKLININKIDPAKINILHNTLDPFFRIPEKFEKPGYLLDRYNIKKDSKIILTVSRITETESDKGYKKVVELLPELLKENPDIIYILAGKYEESAGLKIKEFASKLKMDNNFILTGYIPEAEMTDHYLLADVFVMPSKQEGFGIVFIEALACGVTVIGGNMDGTLDALSNGELGYLVNPDIKSDIIKAIMDSLNNNRWEKIKFKRKVLGLFNYLKFKIKLKLLISSN